MRILFEILPALVAILSVAATVGCLRAADAPAPPALPESPTPGTYTLKISSGGHERTAQVHIPKGYSTGAKPPLVMVLHGGGGGAESILVKNGWTTKADSEGFLVVAPIGLPARPTAKANFLTNPRLWNSGQLKPGTPRAEIDDVAFISELLAALEKRVPYDAKRFYVTGHSNGGGMTFMLASKMADRITAIATVAGQFAVENAQPAKPLPTLYIYGTKDPLMPIDGGETKSPWGSRTTGPVAEMLGKWAKANAARASRRR